MQLGKAEQDSMEVDNLCNRLVDELHSVHSHPGHLTAFVGPHERHTDPCSNTDT